jgi:hypothetical protein
MKIGRNDPCPCGSGKKFKKCCYGKNRASPPAVHLQLERLKAKQLQIEKQQGLGRSIISIEFKGYRFIAVGNRMYYSKKWKTFHDFLFEYIRMIFGKEWVQAEFTKQFKERHPVAQWHEIAHKYMRKYLSDDCTIKNVPMTGAVSAYLNLSYNLYLLAHNLKVQERLIRRLKDISQFRGAQYETYVAAEFIKAGFSLEIENEEDSRTTHCEFTAITKATGQKYSVEAKARQPHKENVGIGNQLYNALRKEAKHVRIIFIDLNVADFMKEVTNIVGELKRKEINLKIDGEPTPPAYVFVTNHPYEYDLEGISEHRAGFAHGFKIPEFGFDFRFTNIRNVLIARQKHKDMFDLVKSICEHDEIPSTFDGEAPEFAFAGEETPPRLLIGEKYSIHGHENKDIEGILINATVSETEKKIFGVYRTKEGKQVICTNPITDEELIAYRRQPNTFFGVHLKQGKKAQDPLDLFDFFYDSYKNCTRKKLLSFLENRPDFEKLKNLTTEELLITCCEGWLYSAVTSSHEGQMNRLKNEGENSTY